MGQAKARREGLREHMLEECRKWEFPPSESERLLCAELKKCEVLRVRRIPADQLRLISTKRQQCHSNVRWYVENDPEKRSKAVIGWCLEWPNFILHSVVEQDGILFCITPHELNEEVFNFIPDKKVTWHKNGEELDAYRDGRVIGDRLRAHPEFTTAYIAVVRDRLLSGVDPKEAGDLSDAQIAALKNKHVRE